jgi:hypothetical protein
MVRHGWSDVWLLRALASLVACEHEPIHPAFKTMNIVQENTGPARGTVSLQVSWGALDCVEVGQSGGC